MSQAKQDLKKIHLALIAAQEPGGGGLFSFLQAEVDILSDFAGLRLHKMLLARWPSYGASETLALDKNAKWLLGLLAPHLWKIKVKPSEMIASFQEGTGRIGHMPDGIIRGIRGTLDSSMDGWEEKEKWDFEAEAKVTHWYFPPLDEAREIFTAKHGNVVWPPTNEVAMVEVRRMEAEAAEAKAEERRISKGLGIIIRDYQDAINPPRHRITRAAEAYGTNHEKLNKKSHQNVELNAKEEEFLRVTAQDLSTVAALDTWFTEQRHRNDANEDLLGPPDAHK